MHILLGALIIAGTFLLALQYMSMDFSGFLNLYSAILLGGVPIGVTLMTYRFSTLAAALRGAWSAMTEQPERDRDELLQRLIAFGREVRRDKGLAASRLLEQSGDSVFRHLGGHVLESTGAEEIEADAMLVGNRALEPYRAGERVFSTLGNTAPALGMIGTVIGLIQLLTNMQDFDQLGSGMAIALLTTFYGLILGHVIYLPISRLIADHGAQRAETANRVIDGMLKLARRRPMHEVQAAIGGNGDGVANASGEHATA